MKVVDSSGWLEFFTALAHGAELVTSDSDFEGVDGVTYLPKP